MKFIENRRLTYEGTLVVGAAFFFSVALVMAAMTASFLRHAVPTVGEVIRTVPVMSDANDPGYAPVFRFADQQGRIYECQSRESERPATYHVGDRVKLLYDPQNPAAATPARFFSLWGWSSIFAGAGALFLLALGRELSTD